MLRRPKSWKKGKTQEVRKVKKGSNSYENFEKKRLRRLHRQKIKNMKCCVDTNKPKTMSIKFLRNNHKKVMTQREKYRQIENENHRLLSRLEKIMTRKGKAFGNNVHPKNGLEYSHERSIARKKVALLEHKRWKEKNLEYHEQFKYARPRISNAKLREDAKRHLKDVKTRCRYSVIKKRTGAQLREKKVDDKWKQPYPDIEGRIPVKCMPDGTKEYLLGPFLPFHKRPMSPYLPNNFPRYAEVRPKTGHTRGRY